MRRCEVDFLQAGSCRHPEAMTLSGGRLSQAVFPALAGLFFHPLEGPVVFDTGYDPAFMQATRRFPERLYRWLTPPALTPGEALSEQMTRRGLAPAEVNWVILSHFHGDHVAGLTAFPQARILCARAGLETMRRRSRWGRLSQGLLSELIPPDIDERAVFFEDRPFAPLPSAYAPFIQGADLFGDMSLLAVELPGHCPGHWGLAARDERDRFHLLAGDAAWSSRAIRENRPPPRLTTDLLGRTTTYRETLLRLHQLHNSGSDLLITPSHCLERAREIWTSV
ncbi:MAG: hypothetical protein JWM33_1239 [Caulobacteraceae bacterium]|nr:hypothetical protein [Caulobacteraceae bacterium]